MVESVILTYYKNLLCMAASVYMFCHNACMGIDWWGMRVTPHCLALVGQHRKCPLHLFIPEKICLPLTYLISPYIDLVAENNKLTI